MSGSHIGRPCSIKVVVELLDYLWRPLTDSAADTEFVLGVRNLPQAHEAFLGSLTSHEHSCFLRSADRRLEVNWIIEAGDELVGMSSIYRIDRTHRRAEVGRTMTVDPMAHWLNYFITAYVGFEVMRLNRVHIEVLPDNAASHLRALERFGAIREGVLRQHVVKGGVPVDVHVYGMLASDWHSQAAILLDQFGEPRIACDGADLG